MTTAGRSRRRVLRRSVIAVMYPDKCKWRVINVNESIIAVTSAEKCTLLFVGTRRRREEGQRTRRKRRNERRRRRFATRVSTFLYRDDDGNARSLIPANGIIAPSGVQRDDGKNIINTRSKMANPLPVYGETCLIKRKRPRARGDRRHTVVASRRRARRHKKSKKKKKRKK